MALLFIDSFDHYEYKSADDKWTSKTLLTNIVSFGATLGRNGTGGCFMVGPNDDVPQLSKTLPVARQTLFVGFAMKVVEYGQLSFEQIWQLVNINTARVSYVLESDGTIGVWRGRQVNDDFLGRTQCPLHQGCWYYLEFQNTIDSTSGYIEVRVNGRTEFSFSGNTLLGTSASANRIVFGGVPAAQVLGVAHEFTIDDFYVLDDTGSYNNMFLGDIRVSALFPNSDGAVQWAVSTTGLNYEMINETLPNSDQDYTETSSPSRTDALHMTNLSVNSAYIFGVYTLIEARKNNAGDRNIRPIITTNGSTYVGSSRPINTDYQYWEEVFERNPVQATSWSIADVNSFQVGYELVS